MAATKGALASLENLRKQEDRRQDKLKGGAQIEADKLKDQTLDYSDANVGLGGRLYGSIGSADLAEMLKERFRRRDRQTQHFAARPDSQRRFLYRCAQVSPRHHRRTARENWQSGSRCREARRARRDSSHVRDHSAASRRIGNAANRASQRRRDFGCWRASGRNHRRIERQRDARRRIVEIR